VAGTLDGDTRTDYICASEILWQASGLTDPLAEIVTLLHPEARHFKIVSGAGIWTLDRSEPGQTFYAALLKGSFCLEVDGGDRIAVEAGDFVLIPSAVRFRASNAGPDLLERPVAEPIKLADGEFHVGDRDAAPDVRFLIGHCGWGSADAALLVSLLPALIHVRDQARLTTLVQLLGEESRARRPAREMILSRLVEVLFIEALRAAPGVIASPGLVRGLADERVATALRRMHEHPGRVWTVAELAREAALSRSAFFDRFKSALGIAPMEYLLAWRMALAKNLLRDSGGAIADVARRVGYSSASTFSVAFTRFVRVTPSHYARAHVSD